jgi:hypothetical protein
VNNSEVKLFVGGHNAFVPLIKDTDVSYRNYLKKSGFEIVSDITVADAAVFIEMDDKELEKITWNIPVILIRNEPIVVWPKNYQKNLVQKVSKTIDVGQFNSLNKTFVPWPQDWTQIVPNTLPDSQRLEKVVLINGNKIGFIRGELYSLRRKCVYKIQDLDLYGAGWNIKIKRKILILAAEIVIAVRAGFFPRPKSLRLWFRYPKNYLGAPESKFDVLTKYKYSLVIENSDEYMSEKLFDAFIAGNIPIYVGPDVELFGIPRNLVFQAKPDFDSINQALDKAKNIDYEQWKKELDKWISSPEIKNLWSSTNVYPRIIEDITAFLKVSLND